MKKNWSEKKEHDSINDINWWTQNNNRFLLLSSSWPIMVNDKDNDESGMNHVTLNKYNHYDLYHPCHHYYNCYCWMVVVGGWIIQFVISICID